MRIALAWVVLARFSYCAAAEASVIEKHDLIYGRSGNAELKLDLCAPKDPPARIPAIVWLHGGGWREGLGSKEEARPTIRYFAQNGYVAVAVAYRLVPSNKFPAQIEDVKCAVRWLRSAAAEYNIDSDRIGVAGGSAGGHLALMLGLTGPGDGLEGDGGHAEQSSRVQAVVNYYGPADLTEDEWPPTTERLIVDLLGASRQHRPEAYRLASPITYISSDDPPVLTFHGTADELVPYRQAMRLHERLVAAGVKSQLVTIEDGRHGFNAEQMGSTVVKMMEFFNEHLNPRSRGTATPAREAEFESPDRGPGRFSAVDQGGVLRR